MRKSSKKNPLPFITLEPNRKPTEQVDKMNAKQVAVMTTWRKLSWEYAGGKVEVTPAGVGVGVGVGIVDVIGLATICQYCCLK